MEFRGSQPLTLATLRSHICLVTSNFLQIVKWVVKNVRSRRRTAELHGPCLLWPCQIIFFKMKANYLSRFSGSLSWNRWQVTDELLQIQSVILFILHHLLTRIIDWKFLLSRRLKAIHWWPLRILIHASHLANKISNFIKWRVFRRDNKENLMS